MRGTTRRTWAAGLITAALAAGLVACNGGSGDSGKDKGKDGDRSSDRAAVEACDNGTFTWSGIKRTDRLTAVSEEVGIEGDAELENPVERMYTPEPTVRAKGPAVSSAEVLFSLGKEIGAIDSDARTLAEATAQGEAFAFTDVNQKIPAAENDLTGIRAPGEVVLYAGVREWEGGFRYACPGGRTTTGYARNWSVDIDGALACDETVKDNDIAAEAARRSCEEGSAATRNA